MLFAHDRRLLLMKYSIIVYYIDNNTGTVDTRSFSFHQINASLRANIVVYYGRHAVDQIVFAIDIFTFLLTTFVCGFCFSLL